MPPTSVTRSRAAAKTSGAMAVDEFSGAVADRVGPRGDGMALQVAAQVVGELLHAAVTPLGFLAQRHQQDVVDVARQLPLQAVGAGVARAADGFRRDAVLACRV